MRGYRLPPCVRAPSARIGPTSSPGVLVVEVHPQPRHPQQPLHHAHPRTRPPGLPPRDHRLRDAEQRSQPALRHVQDPPDPPHHPGDPARNGPISQTSRSAWVHFAMQSHGGSPLTRSVWPACTVWSVCSVCPVRPSLVRRSLWSRCLHVPCHPCPFACAPTVRRVVRPAQTPPPTPAERSSTAGAARTPEGRTCGHLVAHEPSYRPGPARPPRRRYLPVSPSETHWQGRRSNGRPPPAVGRRPPRRPGKAVEPPLSPQRSRRSAWALPPSAG